MYSSIRSSARQEKKRGSLDEDKQTHKHTHSSYLAETESVSNNSPTRRKLFIPAASTPLVCCATGKFAPPPPLLHPDVMDDRGFGKQPRKSRALSHPHLFLQTFLCRACKNYFFIFFLKGCIFPDSHPLSFLTFEFLHLFLAFK